MMINLNAYRDLFHKYYIVGCGVRDRTSLGFVVDRWYSDEEVEEEEHEGYDPSLRSKRLIVFYTDLAVESQWGGISLEAWNIPHIAGSSRPKGQLVATELDGKIRVIGSGENYEDNSFADDLPSSPDRGGPRCLKSIAGYVYMCGGNRSVAKMIGKNDWYPHTELISQHPDPTRGGFDDIDGFNENDLYAVGGKGDVCRFDGKKWLEVAFPSNAWISTVCCGADGNVYISGYEGLTFVGSENKWKQIVDGGISLRFKNMVWYHDRVWCTNDYGVWTIYKNKLTKADLPPEIAVCAGNMATADGVLLLGGLGGAAFMENGTWRPIMSRYQMETLIEEDDRQHDLDQ